MCAGDGASPIVACAAAHHPGAMARPTPRPGRGRDFGRRCRMQAGRTRSPASRPTALLGGPFNRSRRKGGPGAAPSRRLGPRRWTGRRALAQLVVRSVPALVVIEPGHVRSRPRYNPQWAIVCGCVGQAGRMSAVLPKLAPALSLSAIPNFIQISAHARCWLALLFGEIFKTPLAPLHMAHPMEARSKST